MRVLLITLVFLGSALTVTGQPDDDKPVGTLKESKEAAEAIQLLDNEFAVVVDWKQGVPTGFVQGIGPGSFRQPLPFLKIVRGLFRPDEKVVPAQVSGKAVLAFRRMGKAAMEPYVDYRCTAVIEVLREIDKKLVASTKQKESFDVGWWTQGRLLCRTNKERVEHVWDLANEKYGDFIRIEMLPKAQASVKGGTK